jgi:hypothetical protein
MSDSTKEQLHGTISARAQMDREFARLLIEDVTSVMSKNMSTLLIMMDVHHVEEMDALKEGAARLGKLEQRMDAGEADRAELRTRLERIEQIMAERPEQRAAEHQALLQAIRDGGHEHGQ